MCNFIVILLFLNLKVMSSSALCNHTGYLSHHHSHSRHNSMKASNTTQQEVQLHYSNASSVSMSTGDDNLMMAPVQDDQLQQQQALRDSDESLNELRLEYYKYKIVSHLDISADPDKLNPDLDEELKNRIKLSRSNVKSNTHPLINSRQKRSLACSEVKSDKNACCLETFYVNFTDIGWDKWIIYPTGYNANYCRGQCDLSHARYYHSTLLSKFSSIIGLCCSPRQMAPLRLLYIDEHNKVLQKTVPDMTVESCDCA